MNANYQPDPVQYQPGFGNQPMQHQPMQQQPMQQQPMQQNNMHGNQVQINQYAQPQFTQPQMQTGPVMYNQNIPHGNQVQPMMHNQNMPPGNAVQVQVVQQPFQSKGTVYYGSTSITTTCRNCHQEIQTEVKSKVTDDGCC